VAALVSAEPRCGGFRRLDPRCVRAGEGSGLLLDALADQVELDSGQGHDVEGVHHGYRGRDDIGGRGLVAGEPNHRDELHTGSEVGGWAASQAASASAERPGTRSRSRAGPLRSWTGVRSIGVFPVNEAIKF
jgi:hypothetical protein